MPVENIKTECFILELESEGTDFQTVFKNQQVAVNAKNDLKIDYIVAILASRGFVLKEKVLSYFSKKSQNFIAAAKLPIPHNAIIPFDDIEKNGRLSLKIWPPQ